MCDSEMPCNKKYVRHMQSLNHNGQREQLHPHLHLQQPPQLSPAGMQCCTHSTPHVRSSRGRHVPTRMQKHCARMPLPEDWSLVRCRLPCLLAGSALVMDALPMMCRQPPIQPANNCRLQGPARAENQMRSPASLLHDHGVRVVARVPIGGRLAYWGLSARSCKGPEECHMWTYSVPMCGRPCCQC